LTSGAEGRASPPKRRKAERYTMFSHNNNAPSMRGGSGERSNGFQSVSQRSLASGVTNGTHKTNSSVNGSNGVKKGVQRPATYFGHDTEEVTRLLIQTLSDLGYDEAAEYVGRESGYELESATVAAFRTAVLSGSWAEAERLLVSAVDSDAYATDGNGLVLAAGSDRNLMRCWIRTQKFLELLEQRDTARALSVLREELTPIYTDTSKLHFLSSLLMCQSFADVEAKTKWDGANGNSRKILLSRLSSKLSFLSPSIFTGGR
jgi:WD repeat-containing protein 26